MATKPKLGDYGELLSILEKNLPGNVVFAKECQAAFELSLDWIGHYLTVEAAPEARRVLEASYSAAVEVTALVSLGIGRAAAFSVRNHYELYLMYLYYRSHPIELDAVMSYRRPVVLPGEVKKYCKEYFPAFETRWDRLFACKKRDVDDYYSVLSAIAHGSALESLPTAERPQGIVVDAAVLGKFGGLIAGVAENLSDFSVSVHDANWLSVPERVRQDLHARFGSQSAQKELSL